MKKSHLTKILTSLIILFLFAGEVFPQRLMEKLDRGLIAIPKGNGQIYVGWRLLGDDFPGVAFNLYHSVGDGPLNKLNASPMQFATDTLIANCNLSARNEFLVRPVVQGRELAASKSYVLEANAPVRNHFSTIPLKPVPGFFRTINGQTGDADGDGEYEIFVMREEYFNPGTTSEGPGDTARMVLDCYRLNGTFLWRYEFGKNIKSEMQNCAPCYVVADFDGNGKAEVCVLASELSVFQSGTAQQRIIGDYLKPDGITLYPYYPGRLERVGSPEFLYMINAETGAPLDSIPYLPASTANPFEFWGPNERPFYQYMSMAYLDGLLPSIVTLRGLGESHPFKINSYDYRNGSFVLRPDSFSTVNTYNASLKYYTAVPDIAFGGHSIRIKDIDNDGKDEVIVTGTVFDHDLKLLYTQSEKGLNHGDSYQILDIDPDRPGLEFFSIQQNNPELIGAALWKSETGEMLQKFYVNNVIDPSRGEAACIIPELRGAQCYGGTPGIMDYRGNYLSERSFIPCSTLYWDADPAKEIIVNDYNKLQGYLQKYNYKTSTVSNILDFKAEGCANKSIQGTVMVADLYGDWREEFILETADLTTLKIFSTSIPSKQRIYTLMHNAGYRTQTTNFGRIGGFYTDYYLGPQMTVFPPSAFVNEDVRWNENTQISTGKKMLFTDDQNGGFAGDKIVNISDTVSPTAVYVAANANYAFAGNGKLLGSMPLIKTGKGNLLLDNIAAYQGNTEIYNGTVFIRGNCSSPVHVYGDVWSGVASKGASGAVLAGDGRFLSGITLHEKAALSPGTSLNVADTLHVVGDVHFQKRSYAIFDIPAKAGDATDFLNIQGKFILTDTITFILNSIGAFPEAGEFPLIRFSQSLLSENAHIVLTETGNRLCEIYYTENQIGVRFVKTRKSTGLTWAGTSALWDAGQTKNWMNQSVSDFFLPEDQVTFDDSGLNQSAVSLRSELPVSGWNVSSTGNYIFSGTGSITGNGGLLKSGTGKLTIKNLNVFKGSVQLTGGITEVNSVNDAGLPGALGASTQNIILSDATLMTTEKTVYTNRNFQLNEKGGKFYVSDSRFQCTLVGVISGAGSLTKLGPGNLILGGVNTFAGGLIVNEGKLILAGKTGNVSSPGTGLITLNGGSLEMSDVQQSETAAWSMFVPAGKTAGFLPDGRCYLTGNLTGAGTLNILIPYIRTEFRGNWSAYTGTINLTYNASYDSHFRINNNFGYPLATFNLTGKAKMYRTTTGSVTVGSVGSADATAELATTDGSGRTTHWIIGANNKGATFAGLISGPGSITKTGTGAWQLSNANTYTGNTTVQGGRLIVANTTGSATGTGSVTVKSGATLSGTGIIGGNVLAEAGAGITTAISGTGNLSINSDLTMMSGSKMQLKIDGNQFDRYLVGANVLLSGSLNISLQSVNLKAGDSFKFIESIEIKGKFDSVTPAQPGIGLAWNLTRINEGILGVDLESAITEIPQNKVNIFPTVVRDFCFLEMNVPVKDLSVEVFNAGGEKIMRINFSGQLETHRLNISKLPVGIYFLKIRCEDDFFQKRIIKM